MLSGFSLSLTRSLNVNLVPTLTILLVKYRTQQAQWSQLHLGKMEGKGQIRSDKRPGQRLLPQVVDYLAIHHPQKVYASFAVSTEVSDGFVDVTMASLANATNKLAWWIQYKLDKDKRFNAICYTGISDIRYTIMILAAIKCGYKVLHLSWHSSYSAILAVDNWTSYYFSHLVTARSRLSQYLIALAAR